MEGPVSGYRTKFRSNLITTDHDVYAYRRSAVVSPLINLSNTWRFVEAAVGLTQAPVSTDI